MHSGTPIEIGAGVQWRSRSKARRNRSKQAMHLEASEPPKSPHKWPFSSLAPFSSFDKPWLELLTLHTSAAARAPLDVAESGHSSGRPYKTASSHNVVGRPPKKGEIVVSGSRENRRACQPSTYSFSMCLTKAFQDCLFVLGVPRQNRFELGVVRQDNLLVRVSCRKGG